MEISTKRTILLLLISIYTFSFSSAQIQEIDEVKIISNRAQNENGIKKGYVISKMKSKTHLFNQLKIYLNMQ